MSISSLSSFPGGSAAYDYRQRYTRPALGLTIEDIKTLLPNASASSSSGNLLADIINSLQPPTLAPKDPGFLISLLRQRYNYEIMVMKFIKNTGVDEDSGDDYEKYLQFPNQTLRSLVRTIVSSSDPDDQKVYKIEQWVIENIEYMLDIRNYGLNEYWALPTLTLLRKTGDCEDGAFLIHSLALHAGVPYDRLRTYGGFVQQEAGSVLLGGHAWTAYRRSTDDEWIGIDWSYYPTDTPLADRTPVRYDTKYVDDFFYFDALRTVDAALINRIRKPIGARIIDTYV